VCRPRPQSGSRTLSLLLEEKRGGSLPALPRTSSFIETKRGEVVVARATAASDLPPELEPFRPELGVGREAKLVKVLELNRADEFVRVADTEMTISAVRKMNERNADCCLVFSSERPSQLAGIFTERDYVRKIMEAKRTTSETPIAAVMTEAERIISAPPDMTVGDCMALMVQHKIRHVPVVEQVEGKGTMVRGVVSTTDLVKSLKRDDESLAGRVPIGTVDSAFVRELVLREREQANQLAVQGGPRLGTQDLLRGGFVAAGAALTALLLQVLLPPFLPLYPFPPPLSSSTPS
jgi:CBS domain-containing protein